MVFNKSLFFVQKSLLSGAPILLKRDCLALPKINPYHPSKFFKVPSLRIRIIRESNLNFLIGHQCIGMTVLYGFWHRELQTVFLSEAVTALDYWNLA